MYLSNSPLLQVQDEVGASPIDIARAYMGSRRLEKGYDSCSLVSKGEQVPQNRFHPPPSLKSSSCWPAAMLQDQHSHITPQSQRGYGLVEFPRTPYSRTLLPKSRDRVCIVTKFSCVSSILLLIQEYLFLLHLHFVSRLSRRLVASGQISQRKPSNNLNHQSTARYMFVLASLKLIQ